MRRSKKEITRIEQQNKWETKHSFNGSLTWVVMVLHSIMHTHHPVLLLCNYHPASTGWSDSSARSTLLTTAFAHSFMLHDEGVNIWCKFWLQQFRQQQGVVKDVGRRWSVIITRFGEKMLTLRSIFFRHHPNAAFPELFFYCTTIIGSSIIRWTTCPFRFHLCLHSILCK